MKYLKYLSVIFILLFILLLSDSLHSFSTGFTGVTKKDDGVGCICHGNFEPNPNVLVTITGPDSVYMGQSVIYTITIKGGPKVTGGFDVAADSGSVDTTFTDTGVKKQDDEITQTMPRSFTGDSVRWFFKYTAPMANITDTLYAVGNSTDGNGINDTTDAWNFSANKNVRVVEPIGIKHIAGKIPESVKLYNNYPNPFNPKTIIKFQIPNLPLWKEGNIMLVVYNSLGQRVTTLVNESLSPGEYEVQFDGAQLPSGIYFYQLTAGDFAETKKMVLTK